MRSEWITKIGHFVLGLVLLISGLNAEPAANAQPVPPPASAAAGSSAGTLDKLDETRGSVIPFLYAPFTTRFLIQVSIDGQPPLPFVVDTGTASALLLTPWAAAQLGLKKQDLTQKGFGYSYATVLTMQHVVLQGKDRTNDVAFNLNQAIIADLSGVLGQQVAGIVGLGMLKPFTTRFDFTAKTLTVFTYPHPPLRLPGAATLPLRPTGDGLYTVPVTLTPGMATYLVLDTGSFNTQVPLAAMSALHPTAISYGHPNEQIDGLYLCPDLRLPSLNLATLRVPDVVVSVLPLARASLGMDILAGYRLTLDGPNAQLTVEPWPPSVRHEPTAPPRVVSWSGVDLKPFGTGWSVSKIEDSSPALKAGLQVGDEFLTVNGQSVAGLSLLQVETMISGPLGRPLRVSLRRGKATQSQTLDVSWTALDEFHAPPDALDGLILKKATGGPCEIVSVLKDCPSGRAGLKTGDKITRMNGELVADMTSDQLANLIRQSSASITLSVIRAGRALPFSVELSSPRRPS